MAAANNHMSIRLARMICCFVLILGWTASSLPADAASGEFTQRGPGGAGGVYVPSFSPYQKDLLFLGTDMGTAFRSTDGGASWEIIHRRNGSTFMQFSPPAVFFEDVAFWVFKFRRLRVSRDQGVNWEAVKNTPWGKERVQHLGALPGNPNVLLVGTKKTVWRSADMGGSFDKVLDVPVTEFVALGEAVYALAANKELMVSRDRGKTWSARPMNIGDGEKEDVFSLAGGQSQDGPVLFAAIRKRGVFRSKDEGATWEQVRRYKGEKLLLMDPKQAKVVYAVQTGSNVNKEVLRSEDGGDTWESAFRLKVVWEKALFKDYNVEPSWAQTELMWGYYITNFGLGMDPFDSRHLILTTQGDMYETRDGGDSWRPVINTVLPPEEGETAPRYASIGLEVTSCWQYYFDPFEKNVHYGAYSDIGFLRSDDAGKTWSWAAKGCPWRNTYYQIAFDPDVPGRIFAATSKRHDIPHDMALAITRPSASTHQGGVVVSDDRGRNWTVPYAPGKIGGLPKLACTAIALDPKSPVNSRTLYAGLFGEDESAGVFRSDDGGKTWAKKSRGLGVVPNMHVLRLAIHPKSGNIYCLITGLRKKGAVYKIPGGVWKSTDKGENWQYISADSDLNWHATSLFVNPENEDEIYVTATSPAGRWLTGGLYRTRNGGATWEHILTDKQIGKAAGGDSWDHTMSFAVHPDDSDLLYVGTTHHGLLYSQDGGSSWESFKAFPFNTIQSVTVDPDDHDRMIVTTFGGGIWEGPSRP